MEINNNFIVIFWQNWKKLKIERRIKRRALDKKNICYAKLVDFMKE